MAQAKYKASKMKIGEPDLATRFIYPDWPAPSHIKAFTTTRNGGYSTVPFDSFNVAHHVNDVPEIVEKNRSLLPNHEHVFWLKQTHSNICIGLDQIDQQLSAVIEADASFTRAINQVSVVMTADCLPLLLCDVKGSVVASVHAGWQGLAAGVIENTVNKMDVVPDQLLVWMGPAISQTHFEVGQNVKFAFAGYDDAFKLNTNSSEQKYFVDLYAIAKQKLLGLGIKQIYGADRCSYAEEQFFYSHRRTTHQASCQVDYSIDTGRMATAIYIG